MFSLRKPRGKRISPKGLRRRQNADKRKGAAMVELAVCLPVFTVLTFGFIDLTNYIYFRQTLKIAAYDGARAAIEPGANQADVELAVSRLMNARGVNNWDLTPPADLENIERGDFVEVALSAPISEVTHFSSLNLFQNGNITVEVAAVKE